MLNKRYFARNPDGSLKRKQPCQTEGCSWPNEHLCFYGKDDTFTAHAWSVLEAETRGTKAGGRMSEVQKGRIAEAQRQRALEKQRENLRRDLQIQEEHGKGFSKKALMEKWRLTGYMLEKALNNSRSACEV